MMKAGEEDVAAPLFERQLQRNSAKRAADIAILLLMVSLLSYQLVCLTSSHGGGREVTTCRWRWGARRGSPLYGSSSSAPSGASSITSVSLNVSSNGKYLTDRPCYSHEACVLVASLIMYVGRGSYRPWTCS
ncbi:hypothetical protein CDL15_Pgr021552 [Punica granatum]|uniref:Uncharacterized protein n=1 Tax=Punica granatum TaxID=22663 RepID=A0A218WSD3_PUNGR|nr:hypothetical protein CDL15_Pgr021552 [Punica granatum]